MMRLASWRLYFRRRSQTVGLVVMMVVLLGMVLLLSNNNNGKPLIASRELYTVQETYHKYTSRSVYYNISVIADKDKASKTASGDWGTILLNGRLTRELDGTFSIEWLESIDIVSKINEEGRGMELSDLTFFNGRLYSFDDRTGIVYEIDYERSMAIARYILVDGDGHSSSKGFKCEWSTVKDGLLYVGGLGKEWTTPEGKVKSRDPQYIKTISTEGKIEHTSWKHVYEGLREATGYENPGYLIHEAVRFNPVDRRWYFMPRRASTEVYNDEADEKRGSNIVITTNEHFDDIQLFHVGEKIPSHGFSAFAFVPHRENEVIALKTEEDEGKIATYITAFDFKTKEVLLPETKIGEVKFEGIEFL